MYLLIVILKTGVLLIFSVFHVLSWKFCRILPNNMTVMIKLSPDENSIDDAEYKLIATITTENKDDLKIKMFPNINIGFDQLFDCID